MAIGMGPSEHGRRHGECRRPNGFQTLWRLVALIVARVQHSGWAGSALLLHRRHTGKCPCGSACRRALALPVRAPATRNGYLEHVHEFVEILLRLFARGRLRNDLDQHQTDEKIAAHDVVHLAARGAFDLCDNCRIAARFGDFRRQDCCRSSPSDAASIIISCAFACVGQELGRFFERRADRGLRVGLGLACKPTRPVPRRPAACTTKMPHAWNCAPIDRTIPLARIRIAGLDFVPGRSAEGAGLRQAGSGAATGDPTIRPQTNEQPQSLQGKAPNATSD